VRALGDFVGPKINAASFYADNSPELIRAGRDLSWVHGAATPGRPATNAVAERAVRSVLENTRTVPERPGYLPSSGHMPVTTGASGTTSRRRTTAAHGTKGATKARSRGKRISFGSLIYFLPSPIRGAIRTFAPRAKPGLFLVYFVLPRGQVEGRCVGRLHRGFETKRSMTIMPAFPFEG
jgi:hypothetical protein